MRMFRRAGIYIERIACGVVACAVKDALDLPRIDDAATEIRSQLDGRRGTTARGSCVLHSSTVRWVQARPVGHLMLAGKRQD
jgi:hypothetical protein